MDRDTAHCYKGNKNYSSSKTLLYSLILVIEESINTHFCTRLQIPY